MALRAQKLFGAFEKRPPDPAELKPRPHYSKYIVLPKEILRADWLNSIYLFNN